MAPRLGEEGAARPLTGCRGAGTDAFRLQLELWIELGGIDYPERAKPLPGVDLDRLRTSWRLPAESWQETLRAYRALLTPEGIGGPPRAPAGRAVPPPEFVPLSKGEAGVFELLEFLVFTPPPPEGCAEERDAWKNMAKLAEENYPKVLSRVLELAAEPTRSGFLEILGK